MPLPINFNFVTRYKIVNLLIKYLVEQNSGMLSINERRSRKEVT